jgi:hypothetical protein
MEECQEAMEDVFCPVFARERNRMRLSNSIFVASLVILDLSREMASRLDSGMICGVGEGS